MPIIVELFGEAYRGGRVLTRRWGTRYSGIMRVFISHASRDRELASQLSDELSTAGFTVWNPEEEIVPGDNWANVLGKALDESDLLVALITRGALDECESLRAEIQYALTSKDFERRLIPVLVRFATFPAGKDVPRILLKMNPICISQPSDGFREVIDRVRKVTEWGIGLRPEVLSLPSELGGQRAWL